MASKKLVAQARGTLQQNREAANKLARGSGTERTQKLLAEAQRGLERRLAAIPGDEDETFTQAQMRATLAQLRLVSRELVAGMGDVLADAAVDGAELAAQQSIDYLLAADRAFRGVGVQPLALREARMFETATQGARSSLLRRLASSGEPAEDADDEPHPAKVGILQRYGMETVGHFEKKIQLGLLQRKSWGEIQDDITDSPSFLQGAPRYWAERIVRTEFAGAMGRAAWETTREAEEQLGDMVKILSGVFDDRTAADSYSTHGQIRRPEEPFESWFGAFAHPPDRPNDRSVMVPHRISWVIPEYLEPREDEEVEARWEEEGHKGEMPERPEMSTVDLELFGKEPPAQLDEDDAG